MIMLSIAVGVPLSVSVPTWGTDKFVKLKATEIRSAFVGMDFTDDVHWALQHFRDGKVKSFHMGSGDSGKWQLEGDVFCVDYIKGQKECHQIWRSGKTYQLRRDDGSVFLEGELVKHQKRG